MLTSQITGGTSYKLNQPTVLTGSYTTTSTLASGDITGWGVVKQSVTEGYSLQGALDQKCGHYTTTSLFNESDGNYNCNLSTANQRLGNWSIRLTANKTSYISRT